MDPITDLAETMYREIGDTNSDWLQGRRGAQAVAERIDSLIKQRIAETLASQQLEKKQHA